MKAFVIGSKSKQQDWVRQLDFHGPRVQTSIWGWALLVVGLCAVLSGLDRAHTLKQTLDDEQLVLQRLSRAQHQQKIATMPSRPASAAEASWSTESLASAAGVARLMAYPWARVLDRVEQAALQEQVLLLTMAIDQDRPLADASTAVQVKLTAAVPTDDVALKWTTTMGRDAQLLSRERLSKPAPSAQGDYPWRAELSWSGGQP